MNFCKLLIALNGSILREVSDSALEIHLSKKKGVVTVIDQEENWQAAMCLLLLVRYFMSCLFTLLQQE